MLMADKNIHEAELTAPNETCSEDVFLPVEYTPTREDVICSRGSISYHHSANIRLRELIDENLEEYQFSKSKVERSALVSRIIKKVQGGNGRFVRQDPTKKRWFQVRSRTTREKVGQAIRAAMKKREQHDWQFAQTKKEARLHVSSQEANSYGRKHGFKSTIMVEVPLTPSPHKSHHSRCRASSFSPALGQISATQLRHDRHGCGQDSRVCAGTIPPRTDTANLYKPSGFSPVRQSDYKGIAPAQDFNYSETEPCSFVNQPGIQDQEDGPYDYAYGVDDLLNSRHRVGHLDLRRQAAGELPRVDREAKRGYAYGLLELQQKSLGFPRPDAGATPALAGAGGARKEPSWYPSALFPESATVFGGKSSPVWDNSRFHFIADGHQTASRSMNAGMPVRPVHAEIPSDHASFSSISIEPYQQAED